MDAEASSTRQRQHMTGFIVGANLPWIAYGGDFGANAWHPAGGLQARVEDLARGLDRVAAAGVRRIRWFMLCDGRAGIRFAADGTPVGLDDTFFPDVDAAIVAAAQRGIEIMFVLLDFLWCAPSRPVEGVQLGGRRDVLQDASRRAALLERVLLPVLQAYGRSPHVFAWDVINEPEWAVCGLGARRRRPCVALAAMRELVRDTAALVHRHTEQQVTVGSASARWLDAWRDLGLDFYQVHWYGHLEARAPLATPVEGLGLDRPVVLGEFPSRVSPVELRRILDTARAAGYAAAFVWSVLAEDSATDFAMAEAALGPNRA
jgi:hypothetical protein